MFERRLYFYVDWLLLGAVLMLCTIGVLMIYSTTYDPTTEIVGTQFYTQLYALAFALVAFAICLSIDYRTLSNYSLLIYAGLVGVLVYALMFGVEAGWGPPMDFSGPVQSPAVRVCQGQPGPRRGDLLCRESARRTNDRGSTDGRSLRCRPGGPNCEGA